MRVLAAIVIVSGAATALAIRFTLAGEAARLTRPRQPALFYRSVGDGALGARAIFTVAHNAGDTPEAAKRALAYGAQVVEIDVVASKGKLQAAHDRPLPALGALRLQAPEIEQVWLVATHADAIELDLKQSSALFVEPLLTFLRSHRGPEVIVSSRSTASLRTLRERAPWVRRFLSVGNRFSLRRLKLDPTLHDGVVQGVSIRQDLLDARTTRWLKAENLVVLAWVVDDVARASELVRYGVDGIATDNLAILELVRQRRQPIPR